MKIDIGKVSPALAVATLTSMGYENVSHNLEDRTITFREGQIDLTKGELKLWRSVIDEQEALIRFKQAYGRASVLETARLNRWQVKETSPNKFQVTRRI